MLQVSMLQWIYKIAGAGAVFRNTGTVLLISSNQELRHLSIYNTIVNKLL